MVLGSQEDECFLFSSARYINWNFGHSEFWEYWLLSVKDWGYVRQFVPPHNIYGDNQQQHQPYVHYHTDEDFPNIPYTTEENDVHCDEEQAFEHQSNVGGPLNGRRIEESFGDPSSQVAFKNICTIELQERVFEVVLEHT